MPIRNIECTDINDRRMFIVFHMKMRRIVFVKLHENDNPEKTTYFRHVIPFL